MMTLLTLCYEFFLTGLFAIGGGLATLPFLTQMSVKYPEWFTAEKLVNMIAISESTPGPIGVNMATYVGFEVFGIPGAVLATLSLVLPSLIVSVIIARAMEKYRQSPLVNTVFTGLRPVVTGLIAAAGYSVLEIVLGLGQGFQNFPWLNAGVLIAIFVLSQIKPLKKLHPILFILLGAALGIVLGLE